MFRGVSVSFIPVFVLMLTLSLSPPPSSKTLTGALFIASFNISDGCGGKVD